MRLNKTIEQFYLAILKYAGMELDDEENIVNIREALGEVTLDDKPITLPYFDSLKNPQGRQFFHLLNESFSSPETAMFALYKRRLTLEINNRLFDLMAQLISVASDPKAQQQIKTTKLAELIGNIGEVDHSIIEGLLKMTKASTKTNDVGFIVDFFLKKNGSIKDVPYAAIGKVNFKLFKEIATNLEEGSGNYTVFGTKLRKKDLTAIYNTLMVIFPGLEDQSDNSVYIDGTDNKIFRYLNILLKVTYMVSSRINEIAGWMKKDGVGDVESIICPESWTEHLEDLYDMASEIRMIPSQTDLSVEAKKLKLDESKANQPEPIPQAPQPPQHQPPQFQPPQAPQQQQQFQQQQPAPQPQAQMSPEEIIRARMQNPMGGPHQPMYPQQQMMMMQPMMNQQQPFHTLPQWMQQEILRTQGQQNPQMMQQPQQPMYPQQQMMMQQQPMYPQQQMYQQPQHMYQPTMGFPMGNAVAPY